MVTLPNVAVVTDMPPVPSGPWFNQVAKFLGPAYLRNAFTKGTEQEVGFLVDALGTQGGGASTRRRLRSRAGMPSRSPVAAST